MVAAFHDMPPIHYNDQVRIADGGQPVRDHEAGPSRCKAGKSPLDLHFGIGIDVAGGFVQDQHGRVRQHHAGDGEKLLLAFGNASAVRRDPGVVAVFQPSDEPVGARLLRRRDDFFHRGVRLRIGDIVPYAAVEKPGVLKDHAELGAQVVPGQPADVDAVDPDAAAVSVVEPHQQVDERRFPRPRFSHDGDAAARLYVEGEMLDQLPVRAVRKRNVVELHPARAVFEAYGILRVGRFRLQIEDVKHALRGGDRGLHLRQHVGDVVEGL